MSLTTSFLGSLCLGHFYFHLSCSCLHNHVKSQSCQPGVHNLSSPLILSYSLTFFRWPNSIELAQLQHLACKLWHSWDSKESPDIGTIQGRPDHVIILPRILCRTWNSSIRSFRFWYWFVGEARVLSIQMMPYSKKTNKQKTTKRISSHFLWVVLHHWTTWAFLLKSVLSFIARLDVTLQPHWLLRYWDVFILFGKWLLAWASQVPTTTMLAPPTSSPGLSDLPTPSSERTDIFPNPVTRVHYSCLMAMLVSLTKTGFTSNARFSAGSGLLPYQSSSVEWATPREKFHYPLPCNLPLSGQWLSYPPLSQCACCSKEAQISAENMVPVIA